MKLLFLCKMDSLVMISNLTDSSNMFALQNTRFTKKKTKQNKIKHGIELTISQKCSKHGDFITFWLTND